MEVLIEAEQLRRPVPGGIGTYVSGLLKGFGDLGQEHQESLPRISILASRAVRDPLQGDADPLAGSRYPLYCSKMGNRLATRAWASGLVNLPRAVRASSFDLLHATSFAYPRRSKLPLSCVVHDVLWREYPGAFTARGVRWHEKSLLYTIEHAGLLIVPSQRTRSHLEAAASGACLSAKNVEVVEWGVDHLAEPDIIGAEALLYSMGVSGGYLICIGTREPRKNLRSLISAYKKARPGLPGPWNLVVVGPRGWGDDVAAAMGVTGVVFTGYVKPGILSGLLREARMAVHVPLAEGFSFPVLEAMFHSVPVVASPLPANGGAALEVDPLDVGAISGAILSVANDDSIRTGLVESGRKRVSAMTWKACARRHIELWESIS